MLSNVLFDFEEVKAEISITGSSADTQNIQGFEGTTEVQVSCSSSSEVFLDSDCTFFMPIHYLFFNFIQTLLLFPINIACVLIH